MYVYVRLPSTCVCDQPFTVEHSLSCRHGGYPIHRHNDIRDYTASLFRMVCMNVTIESVLQPLSGEPLIYRTVNREDGARLDIAATNFWSNDGQRAFFESVSLIHLHNLTALFHSTHATEDTSKRKRENMTRALGKSNMAAFHQLSSEHWVVSGRLLEQCTKDWHPWSPWRQTRAITMSFVWFAATLTSPCSDLLLPACEGHVIKPVSYTHLTLPTKA